jgi:sugar phosphate isomerase/epimerase
MARQVSLAHLTVLSLPPPEMIRVARRTGYDAVGLRLIAVTDDSPGYPLMDAPPLLRETKAALAETGLRVADIEFVKITPEIDIAVLEPFVAAGADLGARHVIAAPYDPDLKRLAARFGDLADLARRYGLGVVLEFFPWTVVPSLPAAAAIVAAAGRENGGILVDALHFFRSASSFADLAAIAPARLPFLHLCDAAPEVPATMEGLLHTARAERLPPGEGGLDLARLLRRMPEHVPLGLEVPMEALTRAAGPEAVARRVRAGAARVLEHAAL